MVNNKHNIAKFLLFVSAAFFFYIILYFPERTENQSYSQMFSEALASLFMAFLVTYFSFWVMNKMNGSKD